eukprot:350483-Chlamydomonas_euryale.AAC.2
MASFCGFKLTSERPLSKPLFRVRHSRLMVAQPLSAFTPDGCTANQPTVPADQPLRSSRGQSMVSSKHCCAVASKASPRICITSRSRSLMFTSKPSFTSTHCILLLQGSQVIKCRLEAASIKGQRRITTTGLALLSFMLYTGGKHQHAAYNVSITMQPTT